MTLPALAPVDADAAPQAAWMSGARRALDANHRDFEAMLQCARRHWQRGRFDVAALHAQAAAQFAWFNHTGVFASPALEGLLHAMSASLPPTASSAPGPPSPRTVLHVLTQAYETGGPTQAVACWLEQDEGRRQRLCLTRQGAGPVPAKLVSRLRSPDELLRLDERVGGLRRRAQALRAAGAQAEAIVLHTHPYDVLPLLAFGAGFRGPPVIYVNHGDHTFWIGNAVAQLVVHMRDSGMALAAARRGVAAARSWIMPRPLRASARTLSREAAKARFGVAADQVLIVTAGDAPKYRPVSGPSLLALVLPVLQAHPGAVLLAAGLAPGGEWSAAQAATGGRVRALGRRSDIDVLHQAADIYLDPFPFSSLTAMLEAGSAGTPVLTYRGHREDCAVLGADTPGIDEYLRRPGDPATLRRELERLVAEPGWRAAVGARLRTAIVTTHDPVRWRGQAAAMYARAAVGSGPAPGWAAPRETGLLDLLIARLMAETGHARGPQGALMDQLGLLPAGARLAAYASLLQRGTVPPLRGLLPEWLLPRMAPGWRRARSRWQAAAGLLGAGRRPV